MAETDNEIRAQFQQHPHGLQQRDHGLFTGPVNGILAASIVYIGKGCYKGCKWQERKHQGVRPKLIVAKAGSSRMAAGRNPGR
jgi:hypothetical protein